MNATASAAPDTLADDAAGADDTLELRVLDGEQAGAQAEVPRRPFEISGWREGSSAEVQLRDPQIGEACVRVTPQAGAARLEVLQGEVEVEGRSVRAGESALWRFYQPLRIGATRLALGEAETGDWQAPVPAPAPVELPAAPPARPEAEAAIASANDSDTLARRLAIGGGIACAAAVLLLMFTHLLTRPDASAPGEQQLATRLLATTPGFQTLQAQAAPDGVVIQGALDTRAQRERLVRLVADAGLSHTRVEVTTGDQLAADVAEVFRVQGIRATAEPGTSGRVTVHTHEADRGALERAVATAQRDVRGLAAVDLRNEPPPAAPPSAPVADDPGKRIASIVPGDTPYVVTADGTRYFAGALLPTGHRIEAIEPNRVLLVQNGQRSELDF
jgi:type III secretion protein D